MKKLLLYIKISIAISALLGIPLLGNASWQNPNEPCRYASPGTPALNWPCSVIINPSYPTPSYPTPTGLQGWCTYQLNGVTRTGRLYREQCNQVNGSFSTSPPPSGTTPPPPPLDISNYVLLAPLPCEEGTPNCQSGGELKTFDASQDKPLSAYLNTMFRIFIGICAVLAIAMIVVGGLEYMTSELVSSKESGKHKITGALLGLLLAFGSYMILNTINSDLLNADPNIPKAVVQVDLEADVPQTAVNGRYRNGATFGNPWNDTVSRMATLPPNVTVNTGECTSIGQRSCTSIRGLNTTVVASIASQQGCGCPIVITGGTESWLHGGRSGNTTHHIGSSTVDLRDSPELNRYLSGGQPLVRMKRYGLYGQYLWEGDHWHIGR